VLSRAQSCATITGVYSCTPVKVTVTEPAGSRTAPLGEEGNAFLHVWPAYALTNSLGLPSYGYSLATEKSQFVKVMNYNFNPNYTWSRVINENLANLSDTELARLTKMYAGEGGDIQAWVNLFIGWISTGAQRRIAAATSDAIVEAGLAQYGAAAVAAFKAAPAYATVPIRRSYRQYVEAGYNPAGETIFILPVPPPAPLPTSAYFNSFYELYLDYRTQAVALSSTEALYAAGYWWVDLGLASFAVGYGAGKGFLWLGDVISPGFSDWLASELGASIEDFVNDVTSIASGEFPTEGCGCSVTIEWDQIETEEDPPKD
jgi:hypothetical protein